MNKFGDIIVPLIIFAVVIIQFIAKLAKAAKQQQQPPAERQRPVWSPKPPPEPVRDDWHDLLDALGKKEGDDLLPIELDESLPSSQTNLPSATRDAIKPVTISAPPPPPPLPVINSEGGEKFTRVSDFASRPLDQIDEHAFEVQRNIAEKFTEKETNITPVAAPVTTGDHRTEHPIRARFRSRQSIREAVIMSEILGSPLAMRS